MAEVLITADALVATKDKGPCGTTEHSVFMFDTLCNGRASTAIPVCQSLTVTDTWLEGFEIS